MAPVSATVTPAASPGSDDFLSFNSMVHLVSTHKLDSTNYLIWFNQVEPILICSDLYEFCDGTKSPPPKTVPSPSDATVCIPNPAYKDWVRSDQRVRTLLQASLTPEAAAVVVGCRTSHQLWSTLQANFSHTSKTREIQLKDELQSLRQGDKSVADYSKKFKSLCDQLAAMGRSIDATDKLHWFLRGLGESFTQFAFTHLSLTPLPSFEDTVSKAISFEIFQSSMAHRSSPQAAFYSNTRGTYNQSGRMTQQPRHTNASGNRGSPSQSGRGGQQRNTRGGKRNYTPRCQICGVEGHKAISCPQRYSSDITHNTANLAETFANSCSVSNTADWYVDTGATAHMTPQASTLDSSSTYEGNSKVIIGNGDSLNVSRVGSYKLTSDLKLLNVLVVPHLTKNLLSISRLTRDYKVDVLFSDNYFIIQNRKTKTPLAQGRLEGDLYVLRKAHSVFSAALRRQRNHGSLSLRHARFSHVGHSVILVLNKQGHLSLSSSLPDQKVCASCQLGKSHRLPFNTSHGKSPFLISGSNNVFVVNGCGSATIIENGTVVSGCSTTCPTETVSDINNCFGIGCCQTTIHQDLYSFTLNLTGLETHGACSGSAFMVAADYAAEFFSVSSVDNNTLLPVSLSWNETFDENSIRCNETCGAVSIPYPFGIEKSCSESDWFNVDCNSSTPYLSAFNNVEVLGFSLEEETLIVKIPMINDCENPVHNTSLVLSGSPFQFSGLDNIFVVEGCGSAAIMENGSVISGCSTTCGTTTDIVYNYCFGIGCCQSTMPQDLKSYYFNLTGLERPAGNGSCGSAFMVDMNSFMEGRVSQQFVPVTLGWWEDRHSLVSRKCRWCRRYGGFCDIYYTDDTSGMNCIYDESSKESHTGVIEGVSISMGSLLLTVIIYVLYKINKKTIAKRKKERYFKRNGGLLFKQQEATHTGLVDKTILFTSNELANATNNFNENRIIGRGGQGTVYKGMLADGRIVAIKKSKVVDESQLEQFINEVVILSQVNHRNVVKLLGCCLETEVPLLVSEFISNGTLYDFIQDETTEVLISLNMRLQIATEVAGALSYLHSSTSIPIYHRDIKTTNILLDEKYRAKVSDFGTSRFVSIDQTHLTTLVKGTFGYLDPEYFQSSQFTEKSDVYSFGVVLLELLTREKPISFTRFGENRSLATYFVKAMEEGRVMSILDTMVVKEGSRSELLAIANLALQCLNLNGKNRPTMKEVATELEVMRLSHVPSTVQTSSSHVKYHEELPQLYGGSTSTSLTFDDDLCR